MLHIIEHTLLDSIKLVPFLFLTYLAMEFLEHKAGDKTTRMVRKAGAFGPLIGGVAGVVPQCGFSAAASNLYAGRIISLGTLLAIYLSTSDEMLPILISNQDKVPVQEMLGILALKALIGVIVGFVVDGVLRHFGSKIHDGEQNYDCTEGHEPHAHRYAAHSQEHAHSHAGHNQERAHSHAGHNQEHAHSHAGHNQEHAHSHAEYNQEHAHSHAEYSQEHARSHAGHNQEHAHGYEEHNHAHNDNHEEHYHIHDLCEHEHCNCEKDGVFLSALKHTLKITFFIILFTFGIELLLHIVGEDVLAALISDRPILGPVIAGIVGLVPNCASSVAITQLYVENVIGLGTMMAGLLVNAGIGILVLFRVNPNKRETLKIMGLLYGIGVAAGIAIELIM